MRAPTSYSTFSSEETEKVGEQIAASLKPGTILLLTGDLGAGKTTLVKGIIHGLTETPKEEIASPTFSYVHSYSAKIPVHHFDLYRLGKEEEFLQAGFAEFLTADSIVCIEWPDKFPKDLVQPPLRAHHVRIVYLAEENRLITVEKNHGN